MPYSIQNDSFAFSEAIYRLESTIRLCQSSVSKVGEENESGVIHVTRDHLQKNPFIGYFKDVRYEV